MKDPDSDRQSGARSGNDRPYSDEADGSSWPGDVEHERPRRSGFRLILLIGVAAAAAAAVFLLVQRQGGGREAAIRAFQDGELGVAEAGFRRAIEEDPDDVTSRIYLGRIFRTQGRFEEAADVLHAASRIAPDDAGVRRELGHLFLDLARPVEAAAQFRLALEVDPENQLNWIGLIVALRAAGDPEADTMLQRAPENVRRELTSRFRRPDTL